MLGKMHVWQLIGNVSALRYFLSFNFTSSAEGPSFACQKLAVATVNKTFQPIDTTLLWNMGAAAPGAVEGTTPSNRDGEHGRSQRKHLEIPFHGKALGKEKWKAQMSHIDLGMAEQGKIGIV